jgi:hypothetical protein
LQELLLVVLTLVAIIVAGRVDWRQRERRDFRRAHPKDYAFRVAFSWGPELRLPKIERLRKHLPWVSERDLTSWIPELEQAERSLAAIVEAGGPRVLGEEEVERRIKELNPFLVGEGLRQAKFLVSYFAMHDGYDKQPVHGGARDA